jgi:aminoglycoside phosphotransferase (APT) family kinase protein
VCARKMHDDEVATDASLVRRLLAAQFPQWANLSLGRVQSSGTDNALYWLGEDMVVRMPRIHWATGQVEKEHRWLPRLAPNLPLAVPVPVAMGQPAEGYPWQWSVCPWLEGENPSIDPLADPCEAARDLAGFIAALQRIDTAGAPSSGRGEPLAKRDQSTREAIAALHGLLDTDALTAAWEVDLRAPAWNRPPVWIHGDIAPGNLLAVDGRLRAVIDWAPGLGDPAVELIVAWNLFASESRDVFRSALGVDDATWRRGRGWALSIALIQLPYYLDTNPVMVAGARHVIAEVLADHTSGAWHTPVARPSRGDRGRR